MNKNFTAKTSSKWLLWSLLTVAVFLLGAIVIAITGLHDVAHARNGKTLTVSVPMAETFYEDEQANIENACEKAFADAFGYDASPEERAAAGALIPTLEQANTRVRQVR